MKFAFACGLFIGSEACSDSPSNWQSSEGESCSYYTGHKYCTSSGGEGSGWVHTWGPISNYADSQGRSATDACCGCGGGTSSPTPTPSPSPTTSGGKIYIIRHGEKNSVGDLSSIGQKRAKYIATIFPGSNFNRPSAIFAGHYGGGTPQRTKHTVQPTADKQGLSVDNSISNTDHSGAARAMLSKVASGHTVLAAWEHCNIRDTCYRLASQSMCDNAFASNSNKCDWWEKCSGCSDHYDGVVELTVKSGRVTAVEHHHEHFNGLNLANSSMDLVV